MIERAFLYVFILAVYGWGFYFLGKDRRFFEFPVISACFVGMFVFNAIGSVFVMFPDLVQREDFFSYEYVMMLVTQAFLFYIIAECYYRVAASRQRVIVPVDRADQLFLFVVLGFIVLLTAYLWQLNGPPPIAQLMMGQISDENLLTSRREVIFNSPYFYLYHIACSVLPIVACALALVLFLLGRLGRVMLSGVLAICLITACLPGTKGGTADLLIALFLTYQLFCKGYLSFSKHPESYKLILILLVLGMAPIAWMYTLYFQQDDAVTLVFSFFFRIVGVYTETVAAGVAYTRYVRFLGGSTYPNFKGLLGSEQISLDHEMHTFLSDAEGGAPCSAVTEGFVNFGWPGFLITAVLAFIVVVMVQDVLRRLPLNLLTFSLLIFYSMLAMRLSMVSLFNTFISLSYTVTVGLLALTYFLTHKCLSNRTALVQPP